MIELPDKRAIFILAPVIGFGLLSHFLPAGNAYAVVVERVLFGALVVAGGAFVALDLREGYCLNRPSVTRQDSPFLYSLEILAASWLAGVGVYKFWGTL